MKLKLIESDKIEDIICNDVKENEVKNIINNIVPDIIKFIQDLEKKLKYTINLPGLAAPQLGDFRKYFIRFYDKDNYKVYFNCWFINKGSSRVQSKEGCFSYDLGKKSNIVKRWKSIILFHDVWLEKENRFLRKQKIRFRGYEAIIIQHETCHLYGKTIFNE